MRINSWTAATLGVDARHEGVGGGSEKDSGAGKSDCLSDTDTVYYKLN